MFTKLVAKMFKRNKKMNGCKKCLYLSFDQDHRER